MDQPDPFDGMAQLNSNEQPILSNQNRSDELERYKKLVSKYKKQSSSYKDRLNEAQKQITTLNLKNDKLQAKYNSLKEDTAMLELQLEAAKASHVEGETAWSSLKLQNNQFKKANDSLQAQIDSQRKEITKYSKERQDLIELIKNLNEALCKSESNYSKVLYQNQELVKKKNSSNLFPKEKNDLSLISLPFKDVSLKSKIASTLNSPQYKIPQKVQIIVNETSRIIDSKSDEINQIRTELEKANEVNQSSAVNSGKTIEFYESVFLELKKIELSAHELQNKTFYDVHQAFLQFMSKYALDFDFIQNKVTFELFSEDVRSRILSKYDGLSQKFVESLFIINDELNRQLQTAKRSLQTVDEINEIIRIFGCNDPSELPQQIDKFVQKIDKLKNKNAKLLEMLKESQEKLEKEQDRYKQLASEAAQLQSQCNQMSNDMLTKTELPPVTPRKIDFEDPQKDATIKRLQAQIAQKDLQLQQLNPTLDNLKVENLKKSETEAYLRNQLEALQKSYQELKLQQIEYKSKAKKKFKHLQKNNHNAISDLNQQVEEFKTLLSDTTSQYRKKIEQLNSLSQSLSNSLKESEQRNQNLCSDNSRLQIAVQSLQMKISSDEDKMKKEKQANEAKSMAQILAVETKMHESYSIEKAQILRQKQSLIDFVANELGLLYGIENPDLDDESFKELIRKAKFDIQKTNDTFSV